MSETGDSNSDFEKYKNELAGKSSEQLRNMLTSMCDQISAQMRNGSSKIWLKDCIETFHFWSECEPIRLYLESVLFDRHVMDLFYATARGVIEPDELQFKLSEDEYPDIDNDLAILIRTGKR